jgi:RNA polymerase sigma-70 factor, ECF subfamily
MADDLNNRSDEELYAMLRSGGDPMRTAFAELYSRHAARIYTYCRKMLGIHAQAEDAFQETFARFYDALQSDRERTVTNIGAFLLRIARNYCLNERKSKSNGTVQFQEFHLPPYIDRGYETTELMQLVETAMEMLPVEYREALLLKEHLGLSYNDIAGITGTNLPVVRTRIYRAKCRLRDILNPYLEDLRK